MSSLALTSGWYYICTSYCTPNTGLIFIYLHLEKISKRQQQRMVSLPKHYVLNLLLNKHNSKKANSHQLLLGNLTSKQYQKLKSFIVNSNDYINNLFSSFDSLYKELSSGFHLVDNFPDQIIFYIKNCKQKSFMNAYFQNLNKIFKDSCMEAKTVIVISDTNIKNNVSTSISYVCSSQNILAKTIHHTINVTSTEAELFAIRYGINQTIHL